MEIEQTFANFLLRHQERQNFTYHFLILMDAIVSAAKHIEHYYLTGALKGHLGLAGNVNVQGEEVMRMDEIAHEITIHYRQLGVPCLSTSSAMTGSTSTSRSTSTRRLSSGRSFSCTWSLASFAICGVLAPGGLAKATSLASSARLGSSENDTFPLICRSRPVEFLDRGHDLVLVGIDRNEEGRGDRHDDHQDDEDRHSDQQLHGSASLARHAMAYS